MKHLALVLLAACTQPGVEAAPRPTCRPPAPDVWTPTMQTDAPHPTDVPLVIGDRVWMPAMDAQGQRGFARFDPCTNKWSRVPNVRGSFAINGGGALFAEGMLHLVAPNPFAPVRSVPITDAAWKAIEPALVFEGIHAWTGRELLIWRGMLEQQLSPKQKPTGVRVDPATGTVRAIDPKGAPSDRAAGLHVWTGDRWFVWGGVSRSTTDDPPKMYLEKLLADGALYDPAADRWTPIASKGAPAGRLFASVGWTGSRVFVFGGRGSITSNDSWYTDGALYDPKTDRWEAIADPTAVLGKAAMFMGMVGQHMLGHTSHASAIYDPVKRTWSKVERLPFLGHMPYGVTGAPWPAAFEHDGQRAVITRFDPVTKRWQRAKLPTSVQYTSGMLVAWVADRLVTWYPGYFHADKSGGGRQMPAGGVIGVPRWEPR